MGTRKTIGVDEDEATIDISAILDDEVEDQESVTLTLGDGTGYAVGGTDNEATVTIEDATPVITISADPSSTKEGSSTPGKFTFHRSGDKSQALTIRSEERRVGKEGKD